MDRSTIDWSGILGDCGSGNVGNRSWRDENQDPTKAVEVDALAAADVRDCYARINQRLKIALWVISVLAALLCVLAGWVLFEVAR